MAYQVLARQWRPRDFNALVGQSHVRTALANALTQQRLHHAYLFTGTRGVGKTTLARIFAKSLNCERGISSTPCLECAVCLAIEQGHCPDVKEIDGASNTKVDDTRDLIAEVVYAPIQCRFKIYIVDEVHMLSSASFNALLKTLEEPPIHVKFIFATTEPQRLPITILSRCLQFNLKKITATEIVEQLKKILEAEHIPFETSALTVIASQAEGSMRDALSVLDQAICYGDGKIKLMAVNELLGTLAFTPLIELLESLAIAEKPTLLQCLENIAAFNPNYPQVMAKLLHLLYQIQQWQLFATFVEQNIEMDEKDLRRLQNLSEKFSKETVQLYYQIALFGQRDLAWHPDPALGFNMTILRMLSFQPGTAAPLALGQQEKNISSFPSADANLSISKATQAVSAPLPAPAVSSTDSTPRGIDAAHWLAVVKRLPIQGMTAALAAHCEFLSESETQIQLKLNKKHAVLRTSLQEKQLEKALSEYIGREIKLMIIIDDVVVTRNSEKESPTAPSETNPGLQKLMATFNASKSRVD